MSDKELIEFLQEENRKLSNKLAQYQVREKGRQRDRADVVELSRHEELKGKFFSIGNYGPYINQEIAEKLSHCVRTALFPKRSVKRMFKGKERETEMAPRLSDLSDSQYDFYLLALKRIYEVLSDVVREQEQDARGGGETD